MNHGWPSRAISAVVLSSLAMSASGCGFAFTHAPPVGHEQMNYFACTESEAGPVIDFIWAGVNLLGALAIGADPSGIDNPEATVASGLVWAVFSTSAGVVGINKTKKCRTAKKLLAERQAGSAPAIASASPEAGPIQAVVVDPYVDTLAVGQRVQLVASTHGSSGAVVPNHGFGWSSSNDAIASVSTAGLVIAHTEGTVTVAANSENVVGTATVVVVPRR